MRTAMLCGVLTWTIVSPSLAAFDYVIADGYIDSALKLTDQSMLIEGGGVRQVDAWGESYVEVRNTSPFEAGKGGITRLYVRDTSSVCIYGGEIDGLQTGRGGFDMYGGRILSWLTPVGGTGTIQGGYVERLSASSNSVTTITGGTIKQAGGSYNVTPGVRIVFVCDLESLSFTYADGIAVNVSGRWLSGEAFDTAIVNIPGYTPSIEHMQFVPEPATLLLMGLGTFLLHRRRE